MHNVANNLMIPMYYSFYVKAGLVIKATLNLHISFLYHVLVKW